MVVAVTARRSQESASEHDTRLNTMPWGANRRLRHPHLHYLVYVGSTWTVLAVTLHCSSIELRWVLYHEDHQPPSHLSALSRIGWFYSMLTILAAPRFDG